MAGRRRRRKGNPLLTKIFVISIVVHAIALPILAHFGAFKNIRRGAPDSRVTMFATRATEAKEPPKEKAKEKPKKSDGKKANAGNKSASKSNAANLPQPKVVTGGPADGGSGGGPAAESGTGTAGALPVAPKKNPTPATPPSQPTTPTPTVTPPTKVEPPKPEPPKPEPPKVEPPKIEAPKPKKIVEATPIETPEPVIPDDLRTEPFEKTLVVEADVDSGGHPTQVSVATSTGVAELDRIGLETAKKYRFRPATVDDVAVDQHVRFRIIFKVE